MVKKDEPTQAEQIKRIAVRATPYLLISAAFFIGLWVQSNDRKQSRILACEAIIEDRVLIASLVGQTAPPPPRPPEYQAFLDFAQSLLFQPVELCEILGIESRVIIRGANGDQVSEIPEADGVLPPSSTTSPGDTSGSVTVPSNTTETGSGTGGTSPGSQPGGEPGPPGPPGPPGSPGPDPPDRPVVDDVLCNVVGIRC